MLRAAAAGTPVASLDAQVFSRMSISPPPRVSLMQQPPSTVTQPKAPKAQPGPGCVLGCSEFAGLVSSWARCRTHRWMALKWSMGQLFCARLKAPLAITRGAVGTGHPLQ